MSAKRTGKFLGMPYDFRMPTWKRVRQRCWNSDDKRIITPRVFGMGWTVNWYQLLKVFRPIK